MNITTKSALSTLTIAKWTARSGIWFEDGNVVLEAERTRFKVYRGLLASNSSVFKDIFSVPQPPGPFEEAVDGCPLIRLSDSANDVEIVLRALTDSGFVIARDNCSEHSCSFLSFVCRYITSKEPVPLERVVAFLRLGRKYDFEALRIDALRRIFYEVPISLEEYDSRLHNSQIRYEDMFWPRILNLAREQKLISVLPLALFQCCRAITTESKEPSYPFSFASGIRRTEADDPSSSLLSIGDQIMCLSCYPRFLNLQSETTFACFAVPILEAYLPCQAMLQCTSSRGEVF